jgi:hypothetical protein
MKIEEEPALATGLLFLSSSSTHTTVTMGSMMHETTSIATLQSPTRFLFTPQTIPSIILILYHHPPSTHTGLPEVLAPHPQLYLGAL